MSNLFTEDTYEQAVIELFEGMGYEHIYAPDYDRDYTSPFLDAVLYGSLLRINRNLPEEAVKEAILKLKNFDICLLYSSPSPRDAHESRMPSSV